MPLPQPGNISHVIESRRRAAALVPRPGLKIVPQTTGLQLASLCLCFPRAPRITVVYSPTGWDAFLCRDTGSPNIWKHAHEHTTMPSIFTTITNRRRCSVGLHFGAAAFGSRWHLAVPAACHEDYIFFIFFQRMD